MFSRKRSFHYLNPQYDHRPANKKLNSHAEVPVDYHQVKQDQQVAEDDSPLKDQPKKVSPNLIGFNETKYLRSSHKNSDAYKLNAFNQVESDKLHSDRLIPDTRNYKWEDGKRCVSTRKYGDKFRLP